MLTSRVCAGVFQLGSYHCPPSLLRAAAATRQTRFCSACSPSTNAARGLKQGDWLLCWARRAPGAAQRVEQAASELLASGAEQQMQQQMW